MTTCFGYLNGCHCPACLVKYWAQHAHSCTWGRDPRLKTTEERSG